MKLAIDGRPVEVPDGATVLDAVNALGIPLPQLCKDPDRRSEEHTSELQSQSNLVCRLLLEKKNKTDAPSIFRGKLAFLKHGKFHINRSQRELAGAFVRALKTYPQELQVADGIQMDFGVTEL